MIRCRAKVVMFLVGFFLGNVMILATLLVQNSDKGTISLSAGKDGFRTTTQATTKKYITKNISDLAKVNELQEKKLGPKECLPLHYLPANSSYPLTALASFPGSGNTWLRHLLQQATGIHTGSQQTGEVLLKHGFPGEVVNNASVSAVKLHQWDQQTMLRYQRGVLLVRAPGPAVLAEFNRWGGGHVGFTSLILFRGKHWQTFFDDQLNKWRLTNLAWLRSFPGPLHVVMYEDLLSDLETTLRSLLEFLGLPVDEAALRCTLQHPEGAYHRPTRRYPVEPFDATKKRKLAVAEELVYREVRAKRSSHYITLTTKKHSLTSVRPMSV